MMKTVFRGVCEIFAAAIAHTFLSHSDRYSLLNCLMIIDKFNFHAGRKKASLEFIRDITECVDKGKKVSVRGRQIKMILSLS